MIERLRVRIPAGAAGKFSSPESTLCADFYSVSVSNPIVSACFVPLSYDGSPRAHLHVVGMLRFMSIT